VIESETEWILGEGSRRVGATLAAFSEVKKCA
jgi:hypothetical protein